MLQLQAHTLIITSRDRIVVSTLRCGRNNAGSNPGHGTLFREYLIWGKKKPLEITSQHSSERLGKFLVKN